MGFGCYITYRGLDATQKIQTVFIIFQLVVLAIFAGVALYKAVTNTGFANLVPTLEWFNPSESSHSLLSLPAYLLSSSYIGVGTLSSL